ncbi:MAG TPA: hypothetical protein VM935_00220, partial [Chitinophagaceae bacterium]|nr:hypothetical protein [Chitinophagaceae bacterium]
HYTIDSQRQLLMLQNKNASYKGEGMILHYERPSENKLVLNGLDYNGDSIHVVLDKLSKKYLLKEASTGRGKPIKL